MPRILPLVVLALTIAGPALDTVALASGPDESNYRRIRQALRTARRDGTLQRVSRRLLNEPHVREAPALRQFVTGYTGLLAWDRSIAGRNLARSFELAPSPYAAGALATNAVEIGLPDAVMDWTSRGLALAAGRDPDVSAELRLLRAQAFRWLRRRDEQRAETTQALELARKTDNPQILSLALRAQAELAGDDGDTPRAIDLLTAALDLSESAGDVEAAGYHLLIMSGWYYPVHPFADKLPLLDRALRLAREGRDRQLEGRVLGARGAALFLLAQYGAASRDLLAADAMLRQTGARRSRATVAANLSLLYSELGDYARAEQQARLGLALYRRVGNTHGARQSLDDLGRIALQRGDTGLALARHQQAVAISREMQDATYLRRALVRLGLAHLTRGDHAAAEQHVREALELSRDGQDGDALAAAHIALGDVLRVTGRPSAAEDAYRAALATAPQMASAPSLLLRAHYGLARLQSEAGRPEAALSHYRAALADIERARSDARRLDLQLTYFADKNAFYVDAIEALVDAHRRTGSHAHLQEAFVIAERAKARTLLDAVAAAPDQTRDVVSVSSIAAALEPTDLLIEFVAGAEHSYVFSLRHDGKLTVHLLPGRAVLEEQVRRLRDKLATRPAPDADLRDFQAAGERAYAMLLAPALTNADQIRRLILVADGLLFYAPFEAFIVPATGAFVGEQFEVARAASGAVLQAIRTRLPASAPAAHFVGFGEPQLSGKPQSADGLVRALEQDGFLFAPLPGSRREVEAAAGLFDSSGVRLYTGHAFTAAAVLAELQRPNRIVHFATHAVLDERVPERSGIVVSSPDGTGHPTILRAKDLESLRIPVDLVTLSACQTGLGRVVAGEGVLSLAWAFARAGASSLMVTLWNVSDAASASMMTAFYRTLAAGSPKSAALRAARLEFIRGANPALRHPYYWAGYALIGEPR